MICCSTFSTKQNKRAAKEWVFVLLENGRDTLAQRKRGGPIFLSLKDVLPTGLKIETWVCQNCNASNSRAFLFYSFFPLFFDIFCSFNLVFSMWRYFNYVFDIRRWFSLQEENAASRSKKNLEEEEEEEERQREREAEAEALRMAPAPATTARA